MPPESKYGHKELVNAKIYRVRKDSLKEKLYLSFSRNKIKVLVLIKRRIILMMIWMKMMLLIMWMKRMLMIMWE